MKSYFVYQHTRLDINEVFYIGIGTKVTEGRCARHECFYRRAYSVKGRNPYWHYIVNKTDYKVDIIFESANRQEVIDKEIELIAKFKSKPDNCITNISPGGETGSGGLSLLGKQKLREANGIKCYQYDLEGNYIQSFDSMIEASEKTGIGKSSLNENLNGRAGRGGDFQWLKEYKGNKIKPYISRFQQMPNRVYQYSLNGNFIESYASIREAATKTGLIYNRIYEMLFSGRSKGGNFQWFKEYKGKTVKAFKRTRSKKHGIT